MELLFAISQGIIIALLVYYLIDDRKSLLEQRIKKVAKKQRIYARSIARNLAEVFGSFGQENEQNQKQIKKTKLLLIQAGMDANTDAILIFEGRKLMLLILTTFILIVILSFSKFSLNLLFLALVLMLFSYKLPELILKKQIETRQKDFIKNLPDAIDLLSICIKAGLGLDAAISRVASEFSLTSKIVSKEFDRLNRDILSGLSKQEAYRNLALSNPNAEVKSFVALLIQTDKLGTSITQSLDAYCDSVRTRKKQRIEELSQQAAGKMTIPMVLFMLPAIFIVILYPALVKISSNLSF